MSSCDHEPRCATFKDCRNRTLGRVECPTCRGLCFTEAGEVCSTCASAGTVRLADQAQTTATFTPDEEMHAS